MFIEFGLGLAGAITAFLSDRGLCFSGKLPERLICFSFSRMAMVSALSHYALCLCMTQLDIFMKTSYMKKTIMNSSLKTIRLEYDFERTGKMAEG